MKHRCKALQTKLRAFREDRSGSATIETVYAVGVLCAIIMTAMFILIYALQATSITYAAKRITRYVEVTGQATQADLNTKLSTLLSNADDIGASVSITNVGEWKNEGERKLQYRSKFDIVISAEYKVPIINFGGDTPITISMPIEVRVTGLSEFFWKDKKE